MLCKQDCISMFTRIEEKLFKCYLVGNEYFSGLVILQ